MDPDTHKTLRCQTCVLTNLKEGEIRTSGIFPATSTSWCTLNPDKTKKSLHDDYLQQRYVINVVPKEKHIFTLERSSNAPSTSVRPSCFYICTPLYSMGDQSYSNNKVSVARRICRWKNTPAKKQNQTAVLCSPIFSRVAALHNRAWQEQRNLKRCICFSIISGCMPFVTSKSAQEQRVPYR